MHKAGTSSPSSVLDGLRVLDGLGHLEVTRSPSPALAVAAEAPLRSIPHHRRTQSAPVCLDLFSSGHITGLPVSPTRRTLALQHSHINLKAALRRRLEIDESSPVSDWKAAQRVALAVQARQGVRSPSKLAQPPRSPPAAGSLTEAANLRDQLQQLEERRNWREDQRTVMAILGARCKSRSPLGLRLAPRWE